MKTATSAHSTHHFTAWMIVALAALICGVGESVQGAPGKPTSTLETVFDMDGLDIIRDEVDLGIVNGKLALGINFRDVAGIGGLWSPPYVSSNFTFDGRVGGKKIPTSKWNWRPFQVEREGSLSDVAVTSTTTMIYGHRAAVTSFTFKNSGSTAVPLEFFALGWLDAVKDWGFTKPKNRTETTLQADGRLLTLKQGKLAIVAAIDSSEWTWEVSGNLGHAVASLPGKQSHSVNAVIAIGDADEAAASVATILANPADSIATAEKEYVDRVAEVFEKLPTLESDNAQLVRWYNRSLVHLLMNRWELPDFVLKPYYSTGSVNGGCLANYLWNFGELWEIFPLYDAVASREHIKQFLKIDLLKHYNFIPTTGAAAGPWYMINQEKIVGLTYYYVLLTGDTAFLNEVIDNKSIRDHMIIHAMYGDDATKPISLIDYGDSNSHLELRRSFAYNHVSPDLNARRYATYLRAATLCDLAGKPEPFLRQRAELLKPLLKKELWDAKARWFSFKDENGKKDLRYNTQMFKPIGSGVLDKECEEGLISHINDKEFLSAYGLHSISKLDPAYDQFDIDNGGGGACTCFPPQIIERLYSAGHPKLAADLLSRILWWSEVLPYWGDSIAANMKDYRRDTPLQCTFDGATGAQSVIFGVFGVRVRPNGDVEIKPNQLPFASKIALKGLKVQGHSFDVRVDGPDFEVRTGDQARRSTIGNPVVFSTATGKLQK